MSQRLLGAEQAQDLFQTEAAKQGKAGYLPDTSPAFLERLERELAGSVGAATAHAMIGRITGDAALSVDDLLAVADETAQIMEYSSQLEAKSTELGRTARQLAEANEKLRDLSVQKDAFLSQISHELRTPMTSIRAFAEILRDMEGSDLTEQKRYATIMHSESLRLTRLLDDLLDLSVLENGQVELNLTETDLRQILDQAVLATKETTHLTIEREPEREEIQVVTDGDRLAQVFINLIRNAQKYCVADVPHLHITVRLKGDWVDIDFIDNGEGIPLRSQTLIFEKFSRLADQSRAGGAGLGLAICREIMVNLGGSISYLPGQGGAGFRVSLPLRARINGFST